MESLKTNKREIIQGIFNNIELKTIDGFDEAILGVDQISNRVIYSVRKSIKILIETKNISVDDAVREFYFIVSDDENEENKVKAPIWCYDNF